MLTIGLGDPLIREALRMTLRAEIDGDEARLNIARDEVRLLRSLKGNNLSLKENLEHYIHSTKKREYVQLRIISAPIRHPQVQHLGVFLPRSCIVVI
jgi:hypothetical protein